MVMKMIKYPNNIIPKHKYKTYANRGMTLENELNSTNTYYLENNIAVIYKKPTPVKVLKQINGKVIKGYFEKPSTTDYNGLYKGKYIDFEAKETKSKTSFPLNNIHPHQIKHIKNVTDHKGICFLIIRFTTLNETYLLFAKDFLNYIENENKKSIPLSYIKENGHLIKVTLMPEVDYIEIINKYGGIIWN